MSAWEDTVDELLTLVTATAETFRAYRDEKSNPAEWRIRNDMIRAAQERLGHLVVRCAAEVAEGRQVLPATRASVREPGSGPGRAKGVT